MKKLAENFATQSVVIKVMGDEDLADDLAKIGQA